MDTIDTLTAEYEKWVIEQGLAPGSADEILVGTRLSPYERAWLTTFVKRWETADELERLRSAVRQVWDLAQDVCEMDGPHARDTLLEIQDLTSAYVARVRS